MAYNMKKTIARNLIANIISFGINMAISFFLTPYIVENIGASANGFITLGNNIIQYISLISIALNSMASRFIMIEIKRGNTDRANVYFKSVLISNACLSAVLVVPVIPAVALLDKIINIPAEIVTDVRLLFILLIVNYAISLFSSIYSICFFTTNTLYLQSYRDVIGNVLKVAVLVLLFACLTPSVWYVGLAALVMTAFCAVFNIAYTGKLTPEFRHSTARFDFDAVRELVSAGIWNVMTRLGQILTDGLDLLICNLFIDSNTMGLLSIAKTVPLLIQSIIGIVASVFVPDFTRLYAVGDTVGLVRLLNKSIKLLALIMGIPLGLLFAFGTQFFRLWVPGEDAELLQILSVFTILPIIISGSVNTIFNIFTVTNKLKLNSIVLVASGVLNVIVVFILLNTTELGVFAVAGVSSAIIILKNILIIIPYGARCLGQKWNVFYRDILRGILATLVISGLAATLGAFVSIDSWTRFFIGSAAVAAVGTCVNIIILFNRSERHEIRDMIIKRK